MTGSPECVVEMVRGQGVTLVQKGVTPGRFVQSDQGSGWSSQLIIWAILGLSRL